MDFIDFAIGLATGVVIGVVPDLIRHYSYAKHLEKLGGEEQTVQLPLEFGDVPEDLDDQKEREKEEEAAYGFYS